MENNIRFSLDNLKRIAASDLTKTETFEDIVKYFKILWCKRYNLPFKHPLIATYTPYELILEVITCNFLENPKSLDDFIRMDNGEKDAILEDDENWFKKHMGDGYTQEEYHSEEYIRHMKALKKKTGEDVEDLPDGEYKF